MSSVFCIVSADIALPDPAAPLLAYCWKMPVSSGHAFAKIEKAPCSHGHNPKVSEGHGRPWT